MQTQEKNIEQLEEQLSKMSDVQDENEPDGVENKNKKQKRDVTGIQSILDASIMADSSNKDTEISALNEENKSMREEMEHLKRKEDGNETGTDQNTAPNILTAMKDLQLSIDKRFSDMHELINKTKNEDENKASIVSYAGIVVDSQAEKTPTTFREIMMATKNEELAEETEKKGENATSLFMAKWNQLEMMISNSSKS